MSTDDQLLINNIHCSETLKRKYMSLTGSSASSLVIYTTFSAILYLVVLCVRAGTHVLSNLPCFLSVRWALRATVDGSSKAVSCLYLC